MKTCLRWLAVPIFVVAAFASVALAADNNSNYLPLKPGAKWYYDAKVNGQAGAMMIRVADVQSGSGREAAQLETVVNGRVTASEFLGTSAEGVFRLRMDGHDLSPPLLVLRFPVRKGDAWSGESSVAGQKLKADSTVDLKRVSVPAGNFEAALVTTNADSPEGHILNKLWFAPGVGLVKQEVRLSGISISAELTKFEPGK